MSKWGFISKSQVTEKFEGAPGETADMVSEMSSHILDLEGEVSDLKAKLLDAEMAKGVAQAAEAHMRGYIERVRELDGLDKSDTQP